MRKQISMYKSAQAATKSSLNPVSLLRWQGSQTMEKSEILETAGSVETDFIYGQKSGK